MPTQADFDMLRKPLPAADLAAMEEFSKKLIEKHIRSANVEPAADEDARIEQFEKLRADGKIAFGSV